MRMTQTPSAAPQPTPDPSRSLSGQGIARAAGLVTFGFVISSVLGIVRDVIIAARFPIVDTYVAASRPPETVFAVVAGGALVSAFIPTFVSYLTKHDEAEAWRMTSAVLNLIAIIVFALCALIAIFATPIVHYILARGFDDARVIETVALLRIMIITPVIFSISGLVMGMLNAEQRFLLPSIAPAMYNLGIIFGALVFANFWGLYGLA